jgi:hypothetical protein
MSPLFVQRLQHRSARSAVTVLLVLGVLGCADHGGMVAKEGAAAFQVTAEASAVELKRGDTIALTIRIVNVGPSPEVWGHGSSSCRFIAGVILDGKFLPLGPPRICTMDNREYRLDPGEAYQSTLVLDGTVQRNGGFEELPAGPVEIFGGNGAWMSAPVRIRIVD